MIKRQLLAAEKLTEKEASTKEKKNQNGIAEEVSRETRDRIFLLVKQREEGEIFWPQVIAGLHTTQDFLLFFERVGIKNNWSNSTYLHDNGLQGISAAIRKDKRFSSWENFKKYMGIEVAKTYVDQVAECKSKKDFLILFQKIGAGDNWQSSEWMFEAGYQGLVCAIRSNSRFGNWKNFKKFMGLDTEQIKQKLAKCKTKVDFLAFFKERKISSKIWPNAKQLDENGYAYIHRTILEDPRFPEWKNFLKFMGFTIEDTKRELIAKCKTKRDFLRLFKKLGLRKEEWQSSERVNKVSPGFVEAMAGDTRFGGWRQFKCFMGIDARTWKEKVASCKTRNDFLSLFETEGISEKVWTSRSRTEHHTPQLSKCILEDDRFENSWDQFIVFMGKTVKTSVADQVRQCSAAEDFLVLFENMKIPDGKWRSSGWLNNNGHATVQKAIRSDKRFCSWNDFIIFMNIRDLDDEFNRISILKLEESIALLQDDPLKLKRYIQFAHPEFSEEEIDKLVTRSFRGLRDGQIESSEEKYLAWPIKMKKPLIDETPEEETQEHTVTVNGAAPGCSHIFVSGAYTRRKKVEENGKFEITIPLKTGEKNEIRIMGITREKEERSAQQTFRVHQTSEADDVEALVELLSQLGTDVRAGIQKDPGRTKYLCECMEQSLIKKFGRSFQDGVRYVKSLEEKTGTSPMMKKILKTVLKKFIDIHNTELPGVIDGAMLFFQKYCAHEIRSRIAKNLPGVILANDPGTGKTRVVQAATADKMTTVITPNSVVSAWEEEAGRVLENTDVLALRGMHHNLRKEILRNRQAVGAVLQPQQTYVNREFIRATHDAERFKLLSNKHTIVVHDEAHSRTNENSEQSKGARMLESEFQILVSATPFKNPKTFRRMMAILKPDDPRFASDAAFAKAFPDDDPKALKTLSLLKSDVTIRFRKEDVMETVDPRQSLKQQSHKLPIKEFVDPEKHGEFTMNEEQAESIYQMFIDWQKWCKKNEKYIPKDDVSHEDHLRNSDGFAKRHALRQTMNNPTYIGSRAPDAKLREIQRIVSDCMREGRKVVIFCAYEAQALKYSEIFAKYNPALYIGQKSKEGDVKNTSGKAQTFKKGDTGDSQYGWILDKKGYPVPDAEGETMSALDYERITFQNAQDRKLLIATYNAGAVGTTFTAGKALIEDDLPGDCVEEIQAEDRIHRIDPSRMTHASVKYYKMKSVYPEGFLQKVRNRWLVKTNGKYEEFTNQRKAQDYAKKNGLEVVNAYEQFFEQGTFDEVHEQNLKAQRIMFRLINDGIADESVLSSQGQSFHGLMNGTNGNNGD